MGKRGKKSTSSSDGETVAATPVAYASNDDDDDAEANEDLSLKIVEKAMKRAANQSEAAALDSVAVVTDVGEENSRKKKKKKKKDKEMKKSKRKSKEVEEVNGAVSSDLDTNFKSFCGELFQEDDVKEEQKLDAEKVADVLEQATETNPVEPDDNMVLRRLLRGPRYFDPPDSGWGACYNCGEEGHAAVNCTAPKRKRPCFLCGSLEHNAKQCTKGQDCFICKKGGHRAKDCPEKNKGGSQNSKICLKCGDAGHDMFLCRNDYCPNDLKEMQCYICQSFGHLCCVEYTDTGPRDVSCYRCGLLGHTGLACTASRGETSGAGSLSSCYRCGEEGHFARECTSSTKVGKRNREWSTPKKKKSKEDKDYEVRSVPYDLSKARKKKKVLYEGGFQSASKSKHRGGWSNEDFGDFPDYHAGFPSDIKSRRRGGWTTEDPGDYPGYEGGFPSDIRSKRRGGWITEDPGDFYGSKYKSNGWRSPATPSNKKAKNSNYVSSSLSSRSPRQLNFSNSASYGSTKYNPHRFSASRFGNNSSDVKRRNYEW